VKLKLLISIVLAAATIAVYWQGGNNDFVNLDDPGYVYENPHVSTGVTWENLRWAFTSTEMSNWHPLTWLSHMADCELYGLDPAGHHLTNIFLHIVNSILLFFLLDGITGMVWPSAFVAALFALHPLHVESVAWISERKDLLSALFWMLSLLAYARYVKRPAWKRYALVLLLFTLGLMTKPMLVTLPFVLLLLDYWPLDRTRLSPRSSAEKERLQGGTASNGLCFRRLAWEKIPFFVVAAVSSIITFYAQNKGGAVSQLSGIPLRIRVLNALVSYAAYMKKMVWPGRLSVIYPLDLTMPVWRAVAAAAFLAGISFFVFRWGRRHQYVAVGWLWYLCTLVPVIGIVQVGVQSMADRYTYIPLIGLFIIVAWGLNDIFNARQSGRIAAAALSVTVLVALALCTRVQLNYWKNSMELFTNATKVTSGNFVAENLLGVALAGEGRIEEAIDHFRTSIVIEPDYAEAYYDMGNALKSKGMAEEAIKYYREAIRIKPDYTEAHNNLGTALFNAGRIEEAASHFSAVLAIKPDDPNARVNLQTCLKALGKL
jgi:tetratricopeptide (TPR) repeat protein